MIDEPPLLRLRRHFPRPDAALLAGFQGVPTGHLVDAMGGAGCLDYRIKPLGDAPLLGVAVTCHAGPSDNLAVMGALSVARAGDVIVAASEGFTGAAVIGDLILGMARNRGLAGFVTDGLVRDLAGILGVGLPVFCAGLTANSPARSGPGTAGLPIVCGGVKVDSGDIIAGDRDGVVVVPRDMAARVLAKLEDVRAAETRMEARVRGGLDIPDWFVALHASGRVQEID